MKSSIYVLLITAYFLSVQATCNKEEPSILIKNDSTFLSYWYFPKDSYWIYKDSASSQRDTFLIVNNFIKENTENHSNTKYEQHWIQVKNRNIIGAQMGRFREYDKTSNYYILDQRWDLSGYAIRFFYDPKNRSNNLGNTLYLLNKYDSVIIDNVKYHDVIHMYNKGQSAGDYIQEEYYVRNIGIVKRRYSTGGVWSIEKYYIAN